MIKPKTKPFSVQLGLELIDELNETIYWEPGVTVSSFVTVCLREGLDDLKTKGSNKYLAHPERKKSN